MYYNLDNPLRAQSPPSDSPDCSSPLDPTLAIKTQLEFRKFVKSAAQSCAWLSRSAVSEDDVQVAFLSMLQGLDGLRDVLNELPFEEKAWITDRYAYIQLRRFDTHHV